MLLSSSDADENIPVLKIGQKDEIRMTVVVNNNGEDAHESNIYMTLPEWVSYKRTTPAQGYDSVGVKGGGGRGGVRVW